VPLELMFLDEASKQLVLPVTKGDLDEAPDFSDKTEDIQPHVNYWNQMVSGWQEEMEEEEIFAEEIDESEEERLK
ncbi:MAG TPA: hypothetical protein PLU88_15215, partial [Armatimonadota bacterium]|nr:hypothetical protein [Armatimonadota bacterium]